MSCHKEVAVANIWEYLNYQLDFLACASLNVISSTKNIFAGYSWCLIHWNNWGVSKVFIEHDWKCCWEVICFSDSIDLTAHINFIWTWLGYIISDRKRVSWVSFQSRAGKLYTNNSDPRQKTIPTLPHPWSRHLGPCSYSVVITFY